MTCFSIVRHKTSSADCPLAQKNYFPGDLLLNTGKGWDHQRIKLIRGSRTAPDTSKCSTLPSSLCNPPDAFQWANTHLLQLYAPSAEPIHGFICSVSARCEPSYSPTGGLLSVEWSCPASSPLLHTALCPASSVGNKTSSLLATGRTSSNCLAPGLDERRAVAGELWRFALPLPASWKTDAFADTTLHYSCLKDGK